MTQPGTIGTPNRPTRVAAEELYLGTGSPYNTDVGSLLGVTFDVAQTQDGALVFDGEQGPFDGEVTIWVDGNQHPVTAVEYADGEGVRRPVTQWHLGPRGAFLLTLDSLAFIQPAAFGVSITGANGPVAPGDTLDVTAELTNSGDESGTQTVTLDINNSVGQVDSTSVTLSGGGSVTKTLSWSVPSGQTEQDYQATVSSADDSASQTVTVSSGPAPSLVSHWTFDTADTNSGTAIDTVGSNDGTIQGATTGVSGANQTYTTNEAYEFDGTNDSVDVPGTPDFSGGGFSLAVWVQPDTLSLAQNIIGQQDLSGTSRNQRIMIDLVDAGTIEAVVFTTGKNNVSASVPASSVSADTWHHIVGVFNHATNDVKIYLNGSLEDSVNAESFDPALTDIQIGKSNGGGREFDGRIDDPRLYSKELTSTEVSNLYNNGRI